MPRRSSCCCGRLPDAHGPATGAWGILYAGLVELAGVREVACVDHPDVTTGALRGEAGGLVAVTNHGPSRVQAGLRLPPGTVVAHAYGPAGAVDLPVESTGVALSLEPYGATVVGWRTAAG